MAEGRDHAEIMAHPPVLALPARPVSAPVVTAPTCPEHCSGRHQVDGVIACAHCGGEKYQVVLHEWPHSAGHSWTGLVPMNGAPPKRDAKDLVCCGQPMRRVWR